jgi:RNA polymerase sigma factor (sigma-70 family)
VETRSDDVLMQQVRDGEPKRLAVLFERHHRPLFGYFVRITGDRGAGEDMVQDVFFRMLKYRHSYQDGHPFTAWMYGIARRVYLDGLARREAGVIGIEQALGAGGEPACAEPGPRERLERMEETVLLRRALAALPRDKREILVLSRYQNLKYERIAEILDCDPGAVKVRVYRALKSLGQVFRRLSEKAS